MKKFVALLMLAVMLVPFAAMAEDWNADEEAVLTFNRASHVTEWEGQWTLVGAYIGEEYADEYDVETTGFVATVPNAITVTLSTIADASANDKQLGTMVDVASYIHGHTHDLAGELVVSAEIAPDDEPYTVKSAWDEWPNNVIRGENDGDFNYGPAKTHIKGEEDTLYWAEITGVEIEDMDEMKYIGVNNAGQLVLCYADDNVAKKDGELGVAYFFVRAE